MRRRNHCFALLRLLAAASFLALPAFQAVAAEKPSFNRDVRPILAENCFACHGPDSASRKADLRLDRREVAVKAGAIAPGKPDESEMIRRINAADQDEVMPPASLHRQLTASQKETLKAWIAAGAEYQPLWSFIPPVKAALPTVKNPSWVRNPIDHFVLSALERRGLQPAAEADRRTLARRLSLDLTGLPPAPETVEAFVNDKSPNAYEKLVDRFMNSPQWGEHRTRYWLDAARYGDTNGIHFDNYREMWSYRDWVIDAFNQNMPFDRFTVEQLAGDLLPNPADDQRIATGFNRCNITTNEGGAINEEYLVLYTRDRTETTARVWMGLTANCAVCHDHKFDPLPQKEFYALSAFFNNTTQAALDGNVKDTPPVMFVPGSAEDRRRWKIIDRQIADLKNEIKNRKLAAHSDFEKWVAGPAKTSFSAKAPSEGLEFYAPLSEGRGRNVSITVDSKPRTVALAADAAWGPGPAYSESGDGAAKAFMPQDKTPLAVAEAGDMESQQAFSYGGWVKLNRNVGSGAVMARMDNGNAFRGWDMWLQNDRPGAHLINRWPDNAIKVVSKNPIKPGQWHHVMVTYDGSRRAAGAKIYIDGKPQPVDVESDSLRDTMRTKVPLKIAQRNTTDRVKGLALQDLRIYRRHLSDADVDQLASGIRLATILQKPADKRSKAENGALFDFWLQRDDKPFRDLTARLAETEKDQMAIRLRGTVAHVMQERPGPPKAYVLFRGDYDKRREEVSAATPAFLPPMPADLPRNRLGFAKWLVRPEHPLTARVAVNRFWQEIFGTGLVKTTDDFGVNGEVPVHQELLDWLAVDFRESGWDVKRLFRMIVLSAAYRQSAAATPEKLEIDPQDRLLSRGPRFRMDAEMVRDYALAASGLLVEKIGGPSVRPYQPPGIWDEVGLPEGNTRIYRMDSGDKLYRRSLYTFWKREAPPASMDIFNAPARDACCVRRERTNTPLQALVTLNDPQFVEAARHLAEMTLKQSGEKPESRIEFLARRLLARPLQPKELQIVENSLDGLLKHYKAAPAEAKSLLKVGESPADPKVDQSTLAAWTMLTNELMNLDEVLNK
jgi:mono/diheme cytochrome c family protein